MKNNDIEMELKNIKERNKRVELDKSWETSIVRKIIICILTYLIVLIYSFLVKRFDSIFLTSLVSVIGFALSTLSLKYIRKLWEKSYMK
jgi:hypothetical protein